MESLQEAHFIPALTPPGEHMREMLALPARLSGLGLTNPATSAKEQRGASQQITAPLIHRIIDQDHHLGSCHSEHQKQHTKCMKQKEDARELQHNLPTSLQRSMELSQEKGAG